MITDDPEIKWSVVMTGWSGNMLKFEQAAIKAFGKKGLSWASLTLGANKHLPAELADRLTVEKANEIADCLRLSGAIINVVPTENMSDVRHRAQELWADRCTGYLCFTEIDGLITTLDRINALENLAHMKNNAPDAVDWELEFSLNHSHPSGAELPKQASEMELKAVDRLRQSLQEAYPDRAFTISHVLCHQISFWQTTPQSPKDEYHWVEPENASGEVWCQKCSRMRRFRSGSYFDPRFEKAEWGTCEECGEDLLVRSCEKLNFISPVGS